jgi:hypothetical protein
MPNMTTTPTIVAPTSPFRSFPSLSTPSTTTSQEATIKTSIATCPLVEAIEERLCVYHNEEDCGEEELEDAQEQVIIDALQVQEDHQGAETKQLTMQYNQLKERQEIIEKAMNILRDTAATIGRDIENTIRSQERARAKAQTYYDQRCQSLTNVGLIRSTKGFAKTYSDKAD